MGEGKKLKWINSEDFLGIHLEWMQMSSIKALEIASKQTTAARVAL